MNIFLSSFVFPCCVRELFFYKFVFSLLYLFLFAVFKTFIIIVIIILCFPSCSSSSSIHHLILILFFDYSTLCLVTAVSKSFI